jgi:hypothetical protein
MALDVTANDSDYLSTVVKMFSSQETTTTTNDTKLSLLFGFYLAQQGKLAIFTIELFKNKIIGQVTKARQSNENLPQALKKSVFQLKFETECFAITVNYNQTWSTPFKSFKLFPSSSEPNTKFYLIVQSSDQKIEFYNLKLEDQRMLGPYEMYSIKYQSRELQIKDFVVSKEEQHTLCIITENKDFLFYDMEGTLLTQYSLAKLLEDQNDKDKNKVKHDNRKYDIRKLNCIVKSVNDNFFMVILEKYLFFLELAFSDQSHSYEVYPVMEGLFNEGKNLFTRALDYYQCRDEDFVKLTESGSIVIKNKQFLNTIDGFIDELNYYNVNDGKTTVENRIPSNYFFKLISTVNMYTLTNPQSWLSFILIGRWDLLEDISDHINKFKPEDIGQKSISSEIYFNFKSMLKLINKQPGVGQNVITDFMFDYKSKAPEKDSKGKTSTGTTSGPPVMVNRIERLLENLRGIKAKGTGYNPEETKELQLIIDIFDRLEQNGRVYDKFGAIFVAMVLKLQHRMKQ